MEVNGLDEAMSLLRNLADAERADEIMLKSLKREGHKIQSSAKLLCPVDTGQLRRSIVVSDIPMGVQIGTNVEYAEYIEYGTGKLGDNSVSHTTKEYWRYKGSDGEFYTSHGQPPRPFLAPAFEANKADINKNIKNYVVKELKNSG